MEIVEFTDHNILIPFYSRRGIEELDSYPNEPIFSYIVVDNNNITAIIPAFLCDAYEHEYYVLLWSYCIQYGYCIHYRRSWKRNSCI